MVTNLLNHMREFKAPAAPRRLHDRAGGYENHFWPLIARSCTELGVPQVSSAGTDETCESTRSEPCGQGPTALSHVLRKEGEWGRGRGKRPILGQSLRAAPVQKSDVRSFSHGK